MRTCMSCLFLVGFVAAPFGNDVPDHPCRLIEREREIEQNKARQSYAHEAKYANNHTTKLSPCPLDVVGSDCRKYWQKLTTGSLELFYRNHSR